MIIRDYQEVKAEPVTDAGAEKANVRWVIAEKDGAKNFFMRVFKIEPGGYTPLHHHPWEHEMFVCTFCTLSADPDFFHQESIEFCILGIEL